MSFTKEKTKLAVLLAEVSAVAQYSEDNWLKLNEVTTQYSSVLNALYKKKPNVFGNLYKYNIPEIKYNKKIVKQSFSGEAQETNFTVYKESIAESIDSAMDYIDNYI